jgi:hypothetical protein
LPNDEYVPVYPLQTKKKVDHDAATVASLTKAYNGYFHDVDEYVRNLNKQLGKDAVLIVPVGQAVLTIARGTTALTATGGPLQSITVDEVRFNIPPAPAGAYIVGSAYDYSPDGATFSPPITLTLKYDPGLLPGAVDASKLVIAYYDTATSKLVVLPSTVDMVDNTVTAQTSHFTMFAVYAAAPTATPTPTPTLTPTQTPTPTPTPEATPPQPTQNSTIPQELTGVWKSDCGVHVGNQYRTSVWTLKDSTLQMVYDLWDSDSSCSDPSKKFEDFVMTWESDLVTQNTNGSYQVTVTLLAETATELTQDWVAWANDINFYEYNDWQVGVSKDVSGRIREPGASSPELNKGTQFDLLLKVDGDKLSTNLPGLNEVIYTKQ